MHAASAPAPAPQPVGQSEHDKAMAAVVDNASASLNAQLGQQPAQPPTPPQRPAHVPEKFWDAEKGQVRVDDLLKSYGELERGRSQPPAQAPAQQPPANQPAADAAKAAEDAARAAGVDTSKVDFAGMSQHFYENGSLSEDHYKALEGAGISRELVNDFIAGQEARASLAVMEAHKLVGGEEQYRQMVTWAATNLPQAERDAFDAAVMGTPAQRNMAISALKARYAEAVGSAPNLVRGASSVPGGDAFQSTAEVVAAMSDPRYAKDPAYRASVERRLAASSVF